MPIKEMDAIKVGIEIGGEFMEFPKNGISINPYHDEFEEEKSTKSFNLYTKEKAINKSNREGIFEFTLNSDLDKKIINDITRGKGGKVIYEASRICDGTLIFLIDLIESLKKIGCVNIKYTEETVKNPEPIWMNTKFIVTGIMYDTNNWRKLHGLPMIRKRGKR